MKISIVTPSYNQGLYIEQAIKSVLEQSYPLLEYFVFDGGSSDNTIEVIRKYEFRLTYWASVKDKGQADAVNKGWSRAGGQILGWLNSDDYYLPDSLRLVARAFQDHPEVGIVYGRGHFVDEAGKVVQTVGMPVTAQQMVDGSYYVLPQPAVFIRKEVIEHVGMLDTSFNFALDGEFFCRAFANYDSLFLNQPLACLRLHGSSKSVSTGKGFAPEIVRMANKVISCPEMYVNCKVNPDDVLSGAYLNSSRFFYNNGYYKDALFALGFSLRLSRKHVGQVLLREFPRLIAHSLVGKRNYLKISSRLVSGRADG
jgi:glycosyltransferase involved in cell wall biosynthesis